MAGMTEDDKFFITADGKKIAKNGLSPERRQSYSNLISQAVATPAPQMTPVAPAAAPLLQTTAAPQTPNMWEQPAAFDIADPAQLGQAAPQQQASTMDLTPYNAPNPSGDASKMFESATKDYEQGVAKQQLGIQKMANAQMAEAKVVNEESQRLQKELDALEEQRRTADLRSQQARYEADMSIADSLKQYDEAKIDPDRYFAGSTGKRLLAGLAIAFGEVGRALTGGQTNQAMNIINNAIESDVQAQKENRAALGQKVTAQRQIAADLRARFKDEDDALLAQKIVSTTKAQQKIAEIGRQYGTQEAQGKADMLIGQLEQQKGEYLTNLFGSVASKANKMTPAGLTPDQVKIVSDMAGSYEKNDGIGSFNKIEAAYKKMEKLAEIAQKNPNAAQAIITTFNRVLDENSAVREAEVNLTMSAGSVVDKFRQQAEKLATGVMTPAQTANLVEAAQQLRNAALEGKQRIDQRFKQRAEAFGVPSDLVIMASPVSASNAAQELSSFTPQGAEPKSKTQTANSANRVMPGR